MIVRMWRTQRALFGLALLGMLLCPTLLHAEARPFVVPILRPNLGLLLPTSDEQERGIAFHLPMGVAIGWSGSGLGRIINTTPWILPELSYELRTNGSHSSHALSLGCGVGYGILGPIIGTYTQRILIGSADGQTALGFRHGIGAQLLLSVVSIEVSHQVLRTGGITSNEIQITAGLNLGLLLLPVLWE